MQIYHRAMQPGTFDLAQVRLDNALTLFDEFVRLTAKHADAATLRGLERRFAERVQIQPSYWSQIKSRSRQIGERLARQFEHLCHKPRGWLDVPHPAAAEAPPAPGSDSLPLDDDERFIVGLVLTYYRRHPQRARERLLDLLSEVLVAPQDPPARAGEPPAATMPTGVHSRVELSAPSDSADEGRDLWQRTSQGIAPLKRKK